MGRWRCGGGWRSTAGEEGVRRGGADQRSRLLGVVGRGDDGGDGRLERLDLGDELVGVGVREPVLGEEQVHLAFGEHVECFLGGADASEDASGVGDESFEEPSLEV